MRILLEQPIKLLDPSLEYRPDFKAEDEFRQYDKDGVSLLNNLN